MFKKRNVFILAVLVIGIVALSVALSCSNNSTGADVGQGNKYADPGDPGTIYGYVYHSAQPLPIEGAYVTWGCSDCEEEDIGTDYTDEDGRYCVGPFPEHDGHDLKGHAYTYDPEGEGISEVQDYDVDEDYRRDFYCK